MSSRFVTIILFLLLLLAACNETSWQRDPAVEAARNACSGIPEKERYDCYERQAVQGLNPEICRLTGIWIDDLCLQMVYEAANDPTICDRIYLQGVVPNCRAYYAGRTPSAEIQTETPAVSTPESDALTIWGWRLLLLGDDNVVDAGLSLRLHEDGGLSGYSGCRAFNGDYQVRGEQFQISGLEAGGEPCIDPAQEELERRYLEALSQVERFWLGEDLVLTTNQDIELDFMREWVTAAPPPGWESYTQAGNGFLFHYPEGWRVEELPDDPHPLANRRPAPG